MEKRISVREFQLSPTQYLKELPLVLTRYNLPVAVLTQYIATTVNKNVVSEASKNEVQEKTRGLSNGANIPQRATPLPKKSVMKKVNHDNDPIVIPESMKARLLK